MLDDRQKRSRQGPAAGTKPFRRARGGNRPRQGISRDNVGGLRDAGFLGNTIPEEYGGRGFDFLDADLAIEQFAAVCTTMGRITVESNPGAHGAIMATAAQCRKNSSRLTYCLATSRPSASPNPGLKLPGTANPRFTHTD